MKPSCFELTPSWPCWMVGFLIFLALLLTVLTDWYLRETGKYCDDWPIYADYLEDPISWFEDMIKALKWFFNRLLGMD